MVQLFFAIVATVVVVVFAMANTHHVQLSFALGAPFHVRLITLLVVAYAGGLITAWFYTMIVKVRRNSELRRRREIARTIQTAEVEGE